jgi:hypothetical protein
MTKKYKQKVTDPKIPGKSWNWKIGNLLENLQ